MAQKQQDRIPYIPSNGHQPTLEHIWDMTFAKMRDEGIRMVDDAIDIMEPLQRRDFVCGAKYDELLILRKKAEAMPKNYDEAIDMLDATTSQFVKWLNKENKGKWTVEYAAIEIANQTNLWKKYNIDKSFATPPSEEYCQSMWGVSSIEELHERVRKGD